MQERFLQVVKRLRANLGQTPRLRHRRAHSHHEDGREMPCEDFPALNQYHEKEIMMSVINDSRREGSTMPGFRHAGTSELADQSTGDRVQLSSLRRGLLLYVLLFRIRHQFSE